MKTKVIFGSIKRLEHLEDFVLEKTDLITQHFLKNKDYHLEVRLDTERMRTGFKKPSFKCEVLLRIPGKKHEIIVRKFSSNFYNAVTKTEHALKKILRRNAACRTSQRHQRRGAYVFGHHVMA